MSSNSYFIPTPAMGMDALWLYYQQKEQWLSYVDGREQKR